MSLLCIEGVDGAGKGEQINALIKYFTPYYRNVEFMHFPVYDSLTGQAIQKYLKDEWCTVNKDHFDDGTYVLGETDEALDALTLQSLMLINRLEFLDKLNRYANDVNWLRCNRDLLILDRFSSSAMAYGLADGLPRSFLKRIHECLPVPSYSFLLDITVEESFKRRPKRDDAYEADKVRLEKARNNYLEIFATSGPSYYIIDGTQAPDVITKQITNTIEKGT